MAQENSAHGAPQGSFARPSIRASGCRRVTLEMRAWLDRADSFKGLPPGTAKPLTFLYAFKEAEPYLGLPAHTYKLVDWLVRFTKPQDWEEGSRPIAWPAARRQEEFLGLSERRTQALNRVLQEAGILVMRDDPQGRRYGYRDPKTGRITKAFGFDLALLMVVGQPEEHLLLAGSDNPAPAGTLSLADGIFDCRHGPSLAGVTSHHRIGAGFVVVHEFTARVSAYVPGSPHRSAARSPAAHRALICLICTTSG
jgi:Replication protein C N-terminal domain